jgi:hypothetical protein
LKYRISDRRLIVDQEKSATAGSLSRPWSNSVGPGLESGRDGAGPGAACLGLEYFCSEGDALWSLSDADLIALGAREPRSQRRAPEVRDGCVVHGCARPTRSTTTVQRARRDDSPLPETETPNLHSRTQACTSTIAGPRHDGRLRRPDIAAPLRPLEGQRRASTKGGDVTDSAGGSRPLSRCPAAASSDRCNDDIHS